MAGVEVEFVHLHKYEIKPCASNQGMQRLATAEICKWVFAFGMRYIGGLPVHTTYLKRAMGEAEELGRRLGQAAIIDAEGRQEYPEHERYVDSLDKPFSVVEPYLDNLTNPSRGCRRRTGPWRPRRRNDRGTLQRARRLPPSRGQRHGGSGYGRPAS